MRNRRDVANRCNSKTNGLQRAQCRLSTRSGAFHFDFKGTDAMFGSLASCVLRAYLRGIGVQITRPLETHHARGGPAYPIARGVGDVDHSVVEAGVHMDLAGRYFLAIAPTNSMGFTCPNPELPPVIKRSA